MEQANLNKEENLEETEDLSTNEFVYKNVLKHGNSAYPCDFWSSNIEYKSKELFRFYLNLNNIKPRNLPYRDINTLVNDAKLEEPVKQKFLDNVYLFVEECIDSVSLNDLRWNISPEPNPRMVKKLREGYSCTWKSISNYFSEDYRKIKRKHNYESTSKTIDAPVLEVLKFWLNVKRAKDNQISLEELIDNMSEHWDKDRTSRYLNQFNIRKSCGRYNTARKTSKQVNKDNKGLYPSEKLFLEHYNSDVLKLRGYGADFIDEKQSKVIEVKKKLSTINISHAIVQLNYAQDLLKAENKAIYTENVDTGSKKASEYKKYIAHHNIKIHQYDEDNNNFKLVDL